MAPSEEKALRMIRRLEFVDAYGWNVADKAGIPVGGIYCLLGRLRDKGFIEGEEVIQPRRRPKTCYRVTEAGEAALVTARRERGRVA